MTPFVGVSGVAVATAVVVVLAVVLVGLVVVGRETARLDAEPPRRVFDPTEAIGWVGDRLPFEVSAELSYDDVRRILSWHMEYLHDAGLTFAHDAPVLDHEVRVTAESARAAVHAAAARAGASYDSAHLDAVVDGQTAYLVAIGAIAPAAEG